MTNSESRTIAVNNPGGQPRQFCVQFRDATGDLWKRSGVFQNQIRAEECLRQLQTQGVESRVVHYRLPTAA